MELEFMPCKPYFATNDPAEQAGGGDKPAQQRLAEEPRRDLSSKIERLAANLSPCELEEAITAQREKLAVIAANRGRIEYAPCRPYWRDAPTKKE